MSLIIESEPIPLKMDKGGVVHVGGTRVTLETIVAAFQDGATAEEIAQQYPSVLLADVYAVIGYYLWQRSKVDAYLRERQQEAKHARRDMESQFDPDGVRDRLMARRADQRPA